MAKQRGYAPSLTANPLTEIEVQGLGPWRVWAEPSACLLHPPPLPAPERRLEAAIDNA